VSKLHMRSFHCGGSEEMIRGVRETEILKTGGKGCEMYFVECVVGRGVH
jgi:hypothetical protein